MALLHADMAAELAKSSPNLRRALAFTFPDGTKRYSSVPLCSASLGYHDPLVKSWGSIRHAVADRRNALDAPEWSGLQIVDVEKDWSTREGKYGSLKGSAVTLLYGSKNVVPANWLTRFSGILLGWTTADEALINVTCGPNDLALISPFPKLRITRQDFPNLPKESENLYVPIGPYGRHDSFGLGDIDGQITPVYVDTVGFRYLIGLGRIKRVLHAYADGTRLATSQWALVYETVNGHTYSIIDFTTDRSSQQITLDVEGYEFVGDGTGVLIENPSSQLQHWLANFIYNEYLGGNWLPINDAAIQTTHAGTSHDYLAARIPPGYKGSRYFPAAEEQSIGADALDEWAASMEMKPFFTMDGKLAWLPDNLDDPGYLDSPWIRPQHDELASGPMQPILDSQDAVNRIVIEGAYGEALGQYQDKLEIVSQETDVEASDSLQTPWGPAYI